MSRLDTLNPARRQVRSRGRRSEAGRYTFHVSPSSEPPSICDVVGVGANSVDYVNRLPAYPEPQGPFSKMRIREQAVCCGGQTATALAACASLGLRTRYLGATGTDSNGNPAGKREAFQRLLSTEISVHVLSYARMEAEDIEPRTKMITNSPPPKAMPDEIAAQLPNGVRDVATAPKAKTINLDRTLLRRVRARKADLESSEKQLDALAESTNGTSVIPESLEEMVEKTALVAKMIDANYVVTYTPKIPIAETGGRAERNIEVTSKRPGLLVQARRKLIVNAGN